MYPRILHIYGPLWINSYGLMIAIGFFVLAWGVLHHPKRKAIIATNVFWDAIFMGLAAGIIGGRILFALQASEEFAGNWLAVLFPWEPGFSLLGTIIAILLVLPLYLRAKKVPILPFLDLIAIYAPLMQAISRIGCFLGGCCYGIQAAAWVPWAVAYSHPDSLAPHGVLLHPTQLYSSVLSFIIFLLLRFVLSLRLKKPGQLITSYLLLESSARFVVDYVRGDWESLSSIFGLSFWGGMISQTQLIALGICTVALLMFWKVSFRK